MKPWNDGLPTENFFEGEYIPPGWCFGGGGGQPSNQTTVTKSEPWAGQMPYLTDTMQQAQGLYQNYTPQYYPGQTYVNPDPKVLHGLGWTHDRAAGGTQNMMGAGLLDAAQQQGLGTLYGEYMNGNPVIGMATPTAMGNYLYSNPAFEQSRSMAMGDLVGANPGYAGAQAAQSGAFASPVFGNLSGMGSGAELYANPAMGGFAQNAQAQGLGNDPIFGRLADMATTGGMNPYLDQMFQRNISQVTDAYKNAVAPSLMSSFEAMGGTGSSAYDLMRGQNEGNLARQLTDAGNSFYGQAWNQAQQNMLSANQALEQARQAGLAGERSALSGLGGLFDSARQQQLGANSLLSGAFQGGMQNLLGGAGLSGQLYGQERQQQLGASGLLADQYARERQNQLQAMGMIGAPYEAERNRQMTTMMGAPGLSQADYYDIDREIQAGQLGEGYEQARIQDALNRWNFNQQLPYDQLARYIAAVQGNYGGTTTQNATGQMAQGPRFGNALGGGLSGAALAGMTGFNPLLGAALGGLGGLFG